MLNPIIIDNVFSNDILYKIKKYTLSEINEKEWNCEHIDIVPPEISLIFEYFASTVGYNDKNVYLEWWKWQSIGYSQNHHPSWHYDCDEYTLATEKKLIFPDVTIIFYPLIVKLIGGNIVTENGENIEPKMNRMVILPSGTYHTVTDYNAEARVSLIVCPWKHKILPKGDLKYPTDINVQELKNI